MTPAAAATQVRPVITAALRPWQDDLIFDIGMNTGQDAEFYLAKGFRVVAVEANPSQCKAAAQRYASQIAKGRLTIVNRAISDNRNPLLFYVCESHSAWSTASPRLRDFWRARERAVFTEMRVEAITTADLISEFGVPHYAKIDIEGFDLICLNGFAHCEFRPKYLSFEVDFYNIDHMIESVTKLGYSRFALVGQKKVPLQIQPRPAREGVAIDYRFVEGCSGLFGRELPTDWLDVQALRLRCNTVMRQYRAFSVVRHSARILPKSWVQQFQSKHLPLACDWYDMHAAL